MIKADCSNGDRPALKGQRDRILEERSLQLVKAHLVKMHALQIHHCIIYKYKKLEQPSWHNKKVVGKLWCGIPLYRLEYYTTYKDSVNKEHVIGWKFI